MVLTFKRASMPEGKLFYALVKRCKYPGYAQRYRLMVKDDPKRPGKVKLPTLKFDGYLSLEEAKVGKALFDQFAPHVGALTPDLESADNDESSVPY
jgi:hypothetical protein